MKQESGIKIACLGWGSLVWDPRELPIRGDWFTDGPILPVEFARISADGRVTLVTTTVGYRVRVLWTLLSSEDLTTAKKDLAFREGISQKNIKYSIGYCDCKSEEQEGRYAADVRQWATAMQLDCVVWTNLKAGSKGARSEAPLAYDEIAEHFRSLPHAKRMNAERYVRNAPNQIDTKYRRRLHMDFGW